MRERAPAPAVNVHVPKDRVSGLNQSFAFVEFLTEEDAEYAIRIMNMIKLFGKPMRVNKAASARKNTDGSEAFAANLFIGNLHPDVDEKTLYDTFTAFGVIVQTPKVRHRRSARGSLRRRARTAAPDRVASRARSPPPPPPRPSSPGRAPACLGGRRSLHRLGATTKRATPRALDS